jgi:hypothetical protein
MPSNKFSIKSLVVAWLFGSLVTYFVIGFEKNFYRAAWQLALGGILIQLVTVSGLYYMVLGISAQLVLRRHWLLLLAVLAVVFFSISVFWLVIQFPRWFEPGFFLLDRLSSLWFFVASTASILWITAALQFARRSGCEQRILSSRLFARFMKNLPGIVVTLAFLAAYFALAVTYSPLLRDASRNVDDNFYDADPTSWINRFAAPAGELIEMRPVHPFAFLIFRPLTWLTSLVLNENRFYAALLLNSAAGALCVLLAWVFVRRWSGAAYAVLVSSLLGITASHLVFSTFIETYIFSAAALIGFLIIVASSHKSLHWLIPSGLLIFGITITNFIQAGILFVFSQFRLIKIAKFVLIVLVLALALAWLQSAIYPTSQPFYEPAQMLMEDRYLSSIRSPERAVERGYIVARTILLYSTVGPRPLALLGEIDCTFPCFKTYQPHSGRDLITSYAGFGSWLARTWFMVLLLAGAVFARKLIRSPSQVFLQVGLIICLLFNFGLHWVYGDDPMLYSPDWTYALIFFVALSLKDLADRTWIQFAALAFLIALMVNNWNFMHSMLVAVERYL